MYWQSVSRKGMGGLNNRYENEMNKRIEEVIQMLFTYLRRVGMGLIRMRTGKRFGGLLISVILALLGFRYKESVFTSLTGWFPGIPTWLCFGIWGLVLLLPVFYLGAVGGHEAKNPYEAAFAAVGFKSKDGQYPFLVKKRKEKKSRRFARKEKKRKEHYIFSSTIPMSDWVANKEKLETALDCNILHFEEGKSKRITRLVTVPSECRIPTMINWDDSKLSKKEGVVVLGEGAIETISFDLNKTPHMLAAGETGSGKSVILRSCLWQMICQGARLYMIDFKGGVEFGKRYEQFGEVVTDYERARDVLQMLVKENKMRLDLFRDLDCKNLPEYNKKTGKHLARIGLACDEIAEMLDKKGADKEKRAILEELEGLLSTLARLSRATGINLLLGVQRPDANVLTGQIKNNIPIRICGRFADKSASEIVLGNSSAVYLPDIKGRFLFKLGNETVDFQAYYFDDDINLRDDVAVEQGNMLLDEEGPSRSTREEPAKKREPLAGRRKKEAEQEDGGGIILNGLVYTGDGDEPSFDDEMPF